MCEGMGVGYIYIMWISDYFYEYLLLYAQNIALFSQKKPWNNPHLFQNNKFQRLWILILMRQIEK